MSRPTRPVPGTVNPGRLFDVPVEIWCDFSGRNIPAKVYLAKDADPYMDALEAENAELWAENQRITKDATQYAETVREFWPSSAKLQATANNRYVNALRTELKQAKELLDNVQGAYKLPGTNCELRDAMDEVDAFLKENP